jgi:hypothetical protein
MRLKLLHTFCLMSRSTLIDLVETGENPGPFYGGWALPAASESVLPLDAQAAAIFAGLHGQSTETRARTMTRGIHLKHLTGTDLGLLGLPDDSLHGQPPVDGMPANPLAEADPALAKVVDEVRQGLEWTLDRLREALAADGARGSEPPDAGT